MAPCATMMWGHWCFWRHESRKQIMKRPVILPHLYPVERFFLFLCICSLLPFLAASEATEIEERLQQGLELVRQGEYRAAGKIYSTILQEAPENAEALFRMGVLVYLEKDYTGAADYFERAAKQAPERGDVWRRLGEVSMKLGRFEQAARAYNEAHGIEHDRALERKEGVAWLEGGELTGAKRIFEKLLLEDPGDYYAVYYYGNVMLKQGKTDHAARCYEAAIKLRPVLVEAYVNLAAIRFGQQVQRVAQRRLEFAQIER